MPTTKELKEAARLAEELRSLLSEGRGMLKDFRDERRLLRNEVDRMKAELEREAQIQVDGRIVLQVTQTLDQISKKAEAAASDAEDRILTRFDRLARLLTADGKVDQAAVRKAMLRGVTDH